MYRKLWLLTVALLLAVATFGEKREIHILATNDMHASIEYFPQLAAIVDSLRGIDPGLLVFSAGDNRTGNPMNDQYEIPSYPIVALMNLVGFNASAIGNHEFDSGSLPRLVGLSAFRYLCANIQIDDTVGIETVPCQTFDAGGVKVGVVGAIEVGSKGIPASHPDNLHGIHFVQASTVLGQYEWMRRQCDVVVLLSHLGYFTDVETAGKFPWFDVILGGHTHKQLKADEPLHNGVLVTQCGGYLQRAAYVTLTVDSGRVTDKRVEYIDVKKFPKKNKVIASLVESFANSPKFSRVIARAETPFGVKEELGNMICDALKDAYGADVALTNPGGVRLGQLPAGDITVLDVLRFDPFDNKIVVMTLTGKQLLDLMMSCSQRRLRSFPYVSGAQCELTPDDDDATLVKTAKVTLADGKPLKMKQKYRVVTNSYVASTNLSGPVVSQTYDDLTHDVIIRYLEKQKTVSYKGVRRLGITQ